MNKKKDFLIIGAQEPMDSRLKDNSNVFKGIPPYFVPYGRDFIGTSKKGYSFPAYALPVLTSCLKRKKVRASYINDFYSSAPEHIVRAIKDTRLAVGISTTFMTNLKSIVDIARFIRKVNPGLKIMMGGAGIVNFPAARRYADINVFYEGEETISELASALMTGGKSAFSRIKGISYFRSGKEIFTGRRECIEDLGRIPLPDWRPMINELQDEHYLPIESSRGCVGNCAFCLETKYWPGVRYYPIERVLKELKNGIRKFGIKFYYFQDSNIANKREYLRRLCETIRKNRLDIKWSCEARVDLINKDMIERMYDAGCRAITFGLESADRSILKNMNKPISPEKLASFKRIIKHMRKKGMLANINIIVGFPGESKRTISSTIDFLREAEPIAYSMSKFFLEKGTDIWKNKKRYGLKGAMYDWTHDTMKSDELDRIIRDMFMRVSAENRIYHWTSASVDLIRHMSKGKSFDDFVRYISSVNSICVEDIDRHGKPYSSDYERSFKHIVSYLS